MQIDILLLQYCLPCSDAPAMNSHMEDEASKGRTEKRAQNVATEWKHPQYLHPLFVLFEGTTIEEKHRLSELQKKKKKL